MLTYANYYIDNILPKEKTLIINTYQEKVSSYDKRLVKDISKILPQFNDITCVCFWEVYDDFFCEEINLDELKKILSYCKELNYKTFLYSSYHSDKEREIKRFETIAKNLDYLRIGYYNKPGKTYHITLDKNHVYLENINNKFRKDNKQIL